MWELNKRQGTSHAHAIEVVDPETGAIQYIRSGSKIRFIEGEITDIRTQEAYNKMAGPMPDNGEDKPNRKRGKATS